MRCGRATRTLSTALVGLGLAATSCAALLDLREASLDQDDRPSDDAASVEDARTDAEGAAPDASDGGCPEGGCFEPLFLQTWDGPLPGGDPFSVFDARMTPSVDAGVDLRLDGVAASGPFSLKYERLAWNDAGDGAFSVAKDVAERFTKLRVRTKLLMGLPGENAGFGTTAQSLVSLRTRGAGAGTVFCRFSITFQGEGIRLQAQSSDTEAAPGLAPGQFLTPSYFTAPNSLIRGRWLAVSFTLARDEATSGTRLAELSVEVDGERKVARIEEPGASRAGWGVHTWVAPDGGATYRCGFEPPYRIEISAAKTAAGEVIRFDDVSLEGIR